MTDAAPAPHRVIRTPDQRLRVFVSSTLGELAPERAAVKAAIERLRLAPVLFEMGARPHPPRELYRAYLAQSDIFLGIYWQSYGWVAPGEEISGLEDEYRLSGGKPRLIYLKEPAPERQGRLATLLAQIRDEDSVSYQKFSSPEQLAELVANDLALLLTERFDAASAPAAASPSPAQRALPALRGPLIGRENELAQLRARLTESNAGLVTLTGPGGTGKTRLALHATAAVVEQFDDGVVFVPLAPLRDPALVAPTIAQTMNLREHPTLPVGDVLKAAIGNRHLLLVLDNFEQVSDAAPLLADLLTACPRLTILVTSRRPLNVRGEQELPVPPLGLARSGDVRSPAEQLFVERVREIRPGFEPSSEDAELVRRIVARLDGLPLAIELAAARMRTLSLAAVLQRLDNPLDLLTRGARDLPERQQTLRDTIAWSYGLLAAPERHLFRRLSVFRGGWTLAAAEAVCDDGALDVLGALETLIENSLIIRLPSPPDEPRYGMLETIREFAREQIEADGEIEPLRRRHAEYFMSVADKAWPHYGSPQRPLWFARLDRELDNFRAALTWGRMGVERGDRLALELACQIAGRIAWHWYFAGRTAEGEEWGRVLLAAAREAGLTGAPYMRALWAFGMNAYLRTRMAEAVAALAECAPLARQYGDGPEYAACLTYWGTAQLYLSDPTGGQRLLEAIDAWRVASHPWGEALTYGYLAMALLAGGRFEQARHTIAGGVAMSRALGDGWLEGFLLNVLSILATAQGEYELGLQTGIDAVRLLRDGGDRHTVCWPLATAGICSLHLSGITPDWDFLSQALVDGRETGQYIVPIIAIAGLARAAELEGAPELAFQLAALDERLIALLEPYLFPIGLQIARQELGLLALDPAARRTAALGVAARRPEELLGRAVQLAFARSPG